MSPRQIINTEANVSRMMSAGRATFASRRKAVDAFGVAAEEIDAPAADDADAGAADDDCIFCCNKEECSWAE